MFHSCNASELSRILKGHYVTGYWLKSYHTDKEESIRLTVAKALVAIPESSLNSFITIDYVDDKNTKVVQINRLDDNLRKLDEWYNTLTYKQKEKHKTISRDCKTTFIDNKKTRNLTLKPRISFLKNGDQAYVRVYIKVYQYRGKK